MKFIILRDNFNKRIFGIQIILGKYTIQIAYSKFGIYNGKKQTWFPDDFKFFKMEKDKCQ